MCPEPIQRSQCEPTAQERGATRNSPEQTTAEPALAPERDTRSRRSGAAPGKPTIEGYNQTSKLIPKRKLWTHLERTYKQRDESTLQSMR